MKKLIIITMLLLSTVISSKDISAKIIMREYDMWSLTHFPTIENFDESDEDFISPGYYLFLEKYSTVEQYNSYNAFKRVEIEDDIYIPFYYDLTDDISLFKVDELTYFGDGHYDEFQDLMFHVYQNGGYDKIDTFSFYFFYTETYPEDGPPIFISDDEITLQLSQNLSLATIVSNIKSYDYRDGDVSSNITVVSENYSINKNKAGTYYITLMTHDNYNNSTTKEFTIHVIDDLDPTIIGDDILIVTTNYLLSQEELLNCVKATDYKSESLNVFINNETYYDNYTTPGIYDVSFSAIDQNNREVIHNMKISVIDNPLAFYTSSNSKVTFDKNNNYTNSELINIFKLICTLPEHYHINVDSRIVESKKGTYDVFFELYNIDEELIQNNRLTFIFLNDSDEIVSQDIIIQESNSNIGIIISTIVISLITITSVVGYLYYKKRNN